MKNKITRIVVIDLIFLLLLIISSGIPNPLLSDAVYYLAFLIPIFIGMLMLRKDREELRDSDEIRRIELRISGKAALKAAPLVFPAISLICLISYLTALIMGALGYVSSSTVSEPLPLAIILHALIPALLEEMLFRYIPLNLMADNPKCAVVISSLLFAFSHANIFQIPYAAAAGIAFALIDLATGSVVPSFAIHLLNNITSLLLMLEIGTVAVFISLGALSVISVVAVAVRRAEYKKFLMPLTKRGGRVEYGASTAIFVLLTLAIAITAL